MLKVFTSIAGNSIFSPFCSFFPRPSSVEFHSMWEVSFVEIFGVAACPRIISRLTWETLKALGPQRKHKGHLVSSWIPVNSVTRLKGNRLCFLNAFRTI